VSSLVPLTTALPLARQVYQERVDQQAEVRLHGAVVTPAKFIPDGTVVLRGDRIESVGPRRKGKKSAAGADVDTRGLLCPGLIDAHNHLSYNVFPRWEVKRKMNGRFDWRGRSRCGWVNADPDPYYRGTISPVAKYMGDKKQTESMIRYGQIRGLIGGATSIVVDGDFKPTPPSTSAATAELNRYVGSFVPARSHWPSKVWGVLDIGCLSDEDLKQIQKDLTEPASAVLVHMGEGLDQFSRAEFRNLLDKGLLTPRTAIIHAIALSSDEWAEVRKAGASVVWSPSSNFRLYGRSIDIGYILGAGIPTALGPDWSLTGESNLLREMAVVRRHYPWIGPDTLVRMVTTQPGRILGVPDRLGTLAVGAYADLVVFSARPDSLEAAYEAVVHADVEEVRLVVASGHAVYGVAELMREFKFQEEAIEESIVVPFTKTKRTIKVTAQGQRTVAEMVAELAAHLASAPVKTVLAPLVE
jgi:hypothetical protein